MASASTTPAAQRPAELPTEVVQMILALAGEQNVVVLSRALQAGGWLDRDVAAFLLAKFGPDKALVRASHLPDGGTALVASQILMAEHGAQLPPSSPQFLYPYVTTVVRRLYNTYRAQFDLRSYRDCQVAARAHVGLEDCMLLSAHRVSSPSFSSARLGEVLARQLAVQAANSMAVLLGRPTARLVNPPESRDAARELLRDVMQRCAAAMQGDGGGLA